MLERTIGLMFLMSSLFPLTGYSQDQPGPVFSFGVITDVQYADIDQVGARDYRGSPAILEKTIEALNQFDLAFTVNLGDLIDRDESSFELPLTLLKKSKARIHHVFGNHDYTIADDKKALVPGLLGNPKGYHSFEKEGVLFVVLNGMDVSLDGYAVGSKGYKLAAKKLAKLEETGANNAKPWNGGLGETQMKWFEKNLKQAEEQGQKVVVFCHFPVLPENGLQLWNNRDVLELMDKYKNLVAYFSGHHHGGNYVVHQGIHHLTFYGMVEAKSESLGAVVDVYKDRLELHGIGDQEDRVMFIP